MSYFDTIDVSELGIDDVRVASMSPSWASFVRAWASMSPSWALI